jgi:SAM-dependent methyltransferase
MPVTAQALNAESYDEQWRRVDDFILYHPGARHRRRLIYDIISQLNPSSICDVGCGNGAMLSLIRARYPGVALYGADLSPEVVKKNLQRYPSMRFEVLNLEEGHFEAQTDLVICSEVVEHLNDRAPAITNLLKAVKPGGHLLLTAPAGKIFETERRWGHTTHPTVDEFQHHAASNDCEIVRLFNWGFPFYLALKCATNINPNTAMEAFGSGEYSWTKRLLCQALYYVNYLNLSHSRKGCQLVCLLRKKR